MVSCLPMSQRPPIPYTHQQHWPQQSSKLKLHLGKEKAHIRCWAFLVLLGLAGRCAAQRLLPYQESGPGKLKLCFADFVPRAQCGEPLSWRTMAAGDALQKPLCMESLE